LATQYRAPSVGDHECRQPDSGRIRLRQAVRWGHRMTTPRAARGQSALQATSSTDAWLGMGLSDSVDFSAQKRITFWMRSARTGRRADRPSSRIPSSTGASCPHHHRCRERSRAPRSRTAIQRPGLRELDLEDVRGLQWFVRAGYTVTLCDLERRWMGSGTPHSLARRTRLAVCLATPVCSRHFTH